MSLPPARYAESHSLDTIKNDPACRSAACDQWLRKRARARNSGALYLLDEFWLGGKRKI